MTDLTWKSILVDLVPFASNDHFKWGELEVYTVALASRTIIKIWFTLSHSEDEDSKTRWAATFEHSRCDNTYEFFYDVVRIIESIREWAKEYLLTPTRASLNEHLRFLESAILEEIHFLCH